MIFQITNFLKNRFSCVITIKEYVKSEIFTSAYKYFIITEAKSFKKILYSSLLRSTTNTNQIFALNLILR